ncbi:MAG: F0F1 ATP synthase subunit B' [Pseudomonadota bacterium]|nr:F0F1 ATP synthase subunit B' [Pseudomonadota bacterium]
MPQLEQIHTFVGQIFWLVITFGFLYLVLWKAALPRVSSILLERQERIDEDIRRAGEFKQEAEKAVAAYEKLVADARSNAQALIREANEIQAHNAASQQEALTEKIKSDLEIAEKRIQNARAEAINNIQSVSVEVAQAAASRLIGIEIAPEEAKAAVTLAIQAKN